MEPQRSHLYWEPEVLTSVSGVQPAPPLTSSSLKLEFRLSCELTTLRSIISLPADQNSATTVVSVHQHPPISTTVCMTLGDFHKYTTAYDIINQSIGNWPIPSRELDQFIYATWDHARNALISMDITHNYLYVDMQMTATQEHVFDDVSGTDQPCMIPANDSSIESLETMEMEMESGSCSVCLEEFSQDSCEGVSLPCSHVFHQDCIQKWLRVSHLCPNCRFEMPC